MAPRKRKATEVEVAAEGDVTVTEAKKESGGVGRVTRSSSRLVSKESMAEPKKKEEEEEAKDAAKKTVIKKSKVAKKKEVEEEAKDEAKETVIKKSKVAQKKDAEKEAKDEAKEKEEYFVKGKNKAYAKTIVIEHCKQCNAFKTRAVLVKEGLEKAIDGIQVLVNPEKPRRGCFEIREQGGETFLTLLDMKRPFPPLKALDMEKLISNIIEKVAKEAKDEKEEEEVKDEVKENGEVGLGKNEAKAKTIVIEHCKQCNAFKTRAMLVKEALEKAIDGIQVLVNPEKPRRGCFEIREQGSETFLTLLDMKRPFPPLKALDMGKVISDIIEKVK